jgi:putative sterol carrier protein
MSDEYFKALETTLANDSKWNDNVKGLKTTILIGVSDLGQNYLLSVDGGATTLLKVAADTQAEFSFDGTYDAWTRVAKGELDLQSAVLKGQLRFKGSIMKILTYRDRFMRIGDLIKESPKEY